MLFNIKSNKYVNAAMDIEAKTNKKIENFILYTFVFKLRALKLHNQ